MLPLVLALGGLIPTADPIPGVPVPPPPPDRKVIENQAACPGPFVQPFQRVPKVTRVEECSDAREDAGPSPKLWVTEFDRPAHVPLPRFCPDGSPAPTDGLVIYEGMRLTVDPETGTYDVSFTATVPDMPVVLRMQLQFGELPLQPKYTLTLPPIRLDPTDDRRERGVRENTFHVHHRGFSSLFLENPPHPAYRGRPRELASGQVHIYDPTGPNVAIPRYLWMWRVGSARFGSGPPPPDGLRR